MRRTARLLSRLYRRLEPGGELAMLVELYLKPASQIKLNLNYSVLTPTEARALAAELLAAAAQAEAGTMTAE